MHAIWNDSNEEPRPECTIHISSAASECGLSTGLAISPPSASTESSQCCCMRSTDRLPRAVDSLRPWISHSICSAAILRTGIISGAEAFMSIRRQSGHLQRP